MGTAFLGENLLQVRRFRVQYLVSSNHPSPESVKARLDEAATKDLAGALSTALERLFPASDPGVLLIRRLEIDVDVNAAWEGDQLARCWAKQIIRSLDVIQQDETDGENVLRFASRTAYLARFLLDLAQGCAWGKWYYEPFDGLRMLPTSAALRTAICEQPATGFAALVQLPANELEKVLRVLTAQDARRILESIASDGQNKDEDRCLQALWTAWETAQLGPLQASEEWHNALRLYLDVCRDGLELSGPTLRTTALALLRMARRLVSDSTAHGAALLAALTTGDIANLYTTAGASDAEVLLPLLRCSLKRIKEAGNIILSRYTGQVVNESEIANDQKYTSFGGLFLLLPFLDVLPLEKAAYDWPDAGDTPAGALLRFLIFVKCCGQASAQRVFFDPLVRDLMGIDPALSPLAVARWHARISQAKLEAFLKELSIWHYECGAISGQLLTLAYATLPGRAAAVLLDCHRGVWLTALSYQPSRLDRLVERLREWFSQDEMDESLAGASPGPSINRGPTTLADQGSLRSGEGGGMEPWACPCQILFTEGIFAETLRSAFPHINIGERHSPAAIQIAEEDTHLKETLTRLDKLPSDLCHLSMPTLFRISRPFDLALSVLAQGVMRAFAWRLPGFARSGLPYLYSNFLDISGSVEDEPARRVVRVGRPPLNIVLGVTGMAHKTYQVSWLDERPFALFQEE
jgi:hypothetical protein